MHTSGARIIIINSDSQVNSSATLLQMSINQDQVSN